jgi:peptidoglycan/LPS O-acetylase OafA/YrhL
MEWQIQRDLKAVFIRTDPMNNYFDPIDGLRAIASLLILSCHLVTIFCALIPMYPHAEWKQYLRSAAFALSPLMAYALEIFFMLSGFLLTHKQLLQWKNYPAAAAAQHFSLQRYSVSILKRALRFWPGILLSTILMLICGEPRYPLSGYFFETMRHFSLWMFFQNYIDVEYWLASLAPLWSISLDMQIHIILPLLLHLFYSCKNYVSVYHSLITLFIFSIVLSIFTFNPTTMPILLITTRYNIFSLLMPSHYLLWLETNYNFTFPFQLSQSNPMKLFLHNMYLPLEARFGSFIVGSILATHVIDFSPKKDEKKPTFSKFFLLGLVFFYMISSMMQSVDSSSPVPDFVLTIVIPSSRQIFAICQAFILFTALCPSSDPYHSPWIRQFLSSRIWFPISKLSYLVYVIHWRISIELIFGGSLVFLKSYSITFAVIISLPIVLFVSQFISCIWFVLIEKPMERAVNRYLKRFEQIKIHL